MSAPKPHSTSAACQRMIDQQLKARGIRDPRVLEAFRRVDRALFVPPTDLEHAYDDRPLPIGRGQTISQPYIVALMSEQLAVRSTDRVLDIGTGSGYQAALLGRLAAEVHTVERIESLSRSAAVAVKLCGINNVHFHVGDGTLGWPDAGPYDGILVAAAAPNVPKALTDQLVDGGRLILPIGTRDGQILTLIRRTGEKFEQTSLCGCIFVPFIGQAGWHEGGTPGRG